MQIREGLWTPESVNAFWQYHGRKKDLTGYFTYQVGFGVAAFVGHTSRLKPGATVLDYGCGPGFLIQHLLGRRVNCWAADSSAVPFPNGRTFNYQLKPGRHLCAVVERPV